MARGKESEVVIRKRHPMLIRLLFKIETQYKNIEINSKKNSFSQVYKFFGNFQI